MIDTHAHLDALDDPDGAVGRAAEAGVAKILTVGTTIEGCRTALELADAHEGVFAILGIHPHEAASEGGRVAELEPLLRHPSAVAIGEIGLDFYRDLAPRAEQRNVFASELALAELLGKPEWQRGIFVSLELTIVVTIISLVFGALAAYPLARLALPGKPILMTLLIFTQMVPAIVMAIPVLLMFRAVGLKDTVLGLVIVNVAYWLPLVIWLLRNVLDDVPRALEYAARIDGCSRLGTLFRVLIPAAAPGFAAVAILLLIGTWNEFLFAVMLSDRNAVTVTRLIGFLDSTVGPDGPPPFTMLATAGIVAITPCLVLVMAFHRRVVAGLTQGFVKG